MLKKIFGILAVTIMMASVTLALSKFQPSVDGSYFSSTDCSYSAQPDENYNAAASSVPFRQCMTKCIADYTHNCFLFSFLIFIGCTHFYLTPNGTAYNCGMFNNLKGHDTFYDVPKSPAGVVSLCVLPVKPDSGTIQWLNWKVTGKFETIPFPSWQV